MSDSPKPRAHRISRVVAGGLFALFCGLFIQGLTVFGVIAVNSGHLFIFFAWLVGSLMIMTEILPGKPTRHKVAWVVALGITLLVIDVACAVYASRQKREEMKTVLMSSPSPVPSLQVPVFASPGPTPQSVLGETGEQKKNSDGGNETLSGTKQETLRVRHDETGSAFEGNIRIGLNSINFDGNPLHYSVNATISATGHKSLSIRRREVNDPVFYTAEAPYEITVLSTDGIYATFQVTRVQKQEPAVSRKMGNQRSSYATRRKAAIDALLGKPR